MWAFIDPWSYTLLNNHTHHICKIKSTENIALFIEQLPEQEKARAMLSWIKDKDNYRLFDEMLERQMNRFLVSYVNYLNNKYQRKGAVFQSPFKRIQITDDGYLQQAIIYVHANAQKHGIISDYKKYRYSSFNTIIKGDGCYVASEPVIGFFAGIENYIKTHEEQVAYFYSRRWPNSIIE